MFIGTETPRVTGGSPESGSPDDLKTTSTEITHHHNHKHVSTSKIQEIDRSLRYLTSHTCNTANDQKENKGLYLYKNTDARGLSAPALGL